MKILVVDLTSRTIKERPLSDPLSGGRLLTAQLVTEFVPPKTDPLSPENTLVFAAGALASRGVSTSGRLSVGAKSPLTQGIKESNSGGMAGDSMAQLGYRAFVFTGACPAEQPAVLLIDENGMQFHDAAPFLGLGNEAVVAALTQAFGHDYVIVSIGPAGEQLFTAAGIAVTDENGKPFRFAARGGLGAVMGSKGLKAILIKRSRRFSTNSDNSRQAVIGFNKFVATSERVKELRNYGTASTVMLTQNLRGLPTNNFSKGEFEFAESIGGDTLRETILARGGEGTPTEACMAGCVIQCSNIFAGPDGKLAVAPMEYETIGLCGSNLGLASLDEIAKINRICNDLGLDTIEVGAALGVMMEAAEIGSAPLQYREQLPRFGDGKRAAEIVEGIWEGSELGKLAANGVVAAGKALGVSRIPAVKGQAISAYDPRVVKGTGVTYATTPQGADHTAGLTVFIPVDPRDPVKALQLSRNTQLQRASYDALGLCAFNLGATGQRPDLVLNMLRTAYGLELPDNWLDELGKNVIRTERLFNKAAGMTAADDRLPEYFTRESLPPSGDVFDVSDEELAHFWDNL